MGCLWTRPVERWTLADLLRAHADDQATDLPAAPPWGSLAPGAASEAFALAGAMYWRLEDLLDGAVRPEHWSEAVARINEILEWSQSTAWAGQARLLDDALRHGRSADWALVNLRRTVCPDAPPSWRARRRARSRPCRRYATPRIACCHSTAQRSRSPSCCRSGSAGAPGRRPR